ncbi:MAG: ACP S-malonyltransferase [Chloroflexi bacterium]|nr:MAG: ACP S-malonyltransferase [Chloroflexota bacterium]TMF29861.1 MAG: ACP S-malonyltransferase [Chloroflexota bacterium]TMG31785.1 MAG: ACP S-malonyltransferase [Chloroflexota bacterium]
MPELRTLRSGRGSRSHQSEGIAAEVAFLFPGQGSQQPGMGVELLQDSEVSELCDECGSAAGIDLPRLLTTADDDELRLTQNAQPALCFAGLALTLLLRRRGIQPVAAAGHSVGEYAALAAAGSLTAPQVIKAVVERGKAMAEAAPAGTSSMAAVLGLDAQAIEVALAGMNDAWPANYNTPTQTVIAGTTTGLEVATQRLQLAGAKRVIPLNVSAAFHTPLMAPAAERLRAALDRIEWRAPRIPVMANLTGRPHQGGDRIPHVMEMQLRSPVRWAACVASLVEMGCDSFLEVGPKRALTGMMRELAPGRTAVAVGTPALIQELAITA